MKEAPFKPEAQMTKIEVADPEWATNKECQYFTNVPISAMLRDTIEGGYNDY